MLKEYIHDLFTEGLGDIFFMKFYNYVQENIRNKSIKKILIGIYRVIYLLFILAVTYVVFKLSFPL